MRDVPKSISTTILDGIFVGDRRPVARVTVQHPKMKLRNFSFTPVTNPTGGGSNEALPPYISDEEIDYQHGGKNGKTLAELEGVSGIKYQKSPKTKTAKAGNAYLRALQNYSQAQYNYAKVTKNGKKTTFTDPDDQDRYNRAQALVAASQAKLIKSNKAYQKAKGAKPHKATQTYADFLFTNLNKPMELDNVQSVQWNRSVDQDVADCTITLLNSEPLPYGHSKLPGDLDQPGYYTYDRGATDQPLTDWNQQRNEWFGMLVPDNIIRTYEGYGADLTKPPELDPKLVQTGVWMIDTVSMGADGSMTIKCRDIGRILIDQMFYYPVVPKAWYNTGFTDWGSHDRKGKQILMKAAGTAASGAIVGHPARHAMDGSPNTYWLSPAHEGPSSKDSFEHVEVTVPNKTVGSITLQTKKTGYTVFVSVRVGGKWLGDKHIPYTHTGSDNGSRVKYVCQEQIITEQPVTIELPKSYAKVQKIRVTFTNLRRFNFNTAGPGYRAGVRELKVYGITGHIANNHGQAGENPGKYYDFTDIIKLLCAWGGFYWPVGGKQRICNPPTANPKAVLPNFNDLRTCSPATSDPVLGKGVRGRIWGDLQDAQIAAGSEIQYSEFDKKSLMDCISAIRDLLGFLFMVDETGGIVWRSPNWFNKGNMVSTMSTRPGFRKGEVHVLSEHGTIIQLTANLDSKNVREGIFVGNSDGKLGAYAPGFNPNPTGLRRMAGWTDQNWASTRECEVMADMLSLQQLFSYRTDSIRVAGNPAIQIDDQARLREHVTSDGYVHYIRSIASNNDQTSGQWTYDLETNWLGYDPATRWIFKPNQLYRATQDKIDQQTSGRSKDMGPSRLPTGGGEQ